MVLQDTFDLQQRALRSSALLPSGRQTLAARQKTKAGTTVGTTLLVAGAAQH